MSFLHDTWEGLSDGAKRLFDFASAGVALATLAQWLPPIAALVTLIYTVLRAIESRALRAIVLSLTGWDINRWLEAKGDDA